MTPQPQIDAATLCTVTVTFNPDVTLLEAQLRVLPQACTKIIVDNASSAKLLDKVQSLADCTPNTQVLRNDGNIGLSAAVNRGVQAAAGLKPVPEFVLLLDQDTEPQAGSIAALLAAFRILEHDGQKVGCVGPLLFDPQTGLTHGFHQCTRWRWKRAYPPAASIAPVPCANLNGSGTLVRLELFLRLRGLDESLFIDHVDTEWAFRVLAHGYGLWGIPNAVFRHQMGQTSVRFWFFGWRVWPFRSPERHYFLARNATVLMGRQYVPRVWKIWASIKLGVEFLLSLTWGGKHFCQARRMIAGFRDGRRILMEARLAERR